MGVIFKNADNASTIALILAIVVFASSLSLYALILSFFITCDRTAHIFFMLFGLCEMALLIALTVFFSENLYFLGKIDPTRLTYFVENQCSEGPLQVAFEKLANNMRSDKVYAGVGLLFTLLSLIAVISTLIMQTGLRDIFLPKYRKNDPIIFNPRMFVN
jgi:hypothetical protein